MKLNDPGLSEARKRRRVGRHVLAARCLPPQHNACDGLSTADDIRDGDLPSAFLVVQSRAKPEGPVAVGDILIPSVIGNDLAGGIRHLDLGNGPKAWSRAG